MISASKWRLNMCRRTIDVFFHVLMFFFNVFLALVTAVFFVISMVEKLSVKTATWPWS